MVTSDPTGDDILYSEIRQQQVLELLRLRFVWPLMCANDFILNHLSMLTKFRLLLGIWGDRSRVSHNYVFQP